MFSLIVSPSTCTIFAPFKVHLSGLQYSLSSPSQSANTRYEPSTPFAFDLYPQATAMDSLSSADEAPLYPVADEAPQFPVADEAP